MVGNSQTGEMDKIDGPYYFFKVIQRVRGLVPPWMPTVGLEGGPINLVPVDFVAAAMDHIAHQDGLDGQAFHLTDPNPKTAGQVINVFSRAAHAPEAAMRIDRQMMNVVPKQARRMLAQLPVVKRITDQVLGDFGIPREVLSYIDYPSEYDSRDAQRALEGSGIQIPALEGYADRLWDYWERNLDPDLFKDRSLRGSDRGQGRGDHRRVERHRQGARDEGRRGRRDRRAGRALRGQARGDQGRDRGRPAARPRFTRPTSPSSRTCDRVVAEILAEHGRVDILVNNAGRSIRRSIGNSYDRFHDFQRTMQLNYFGALKLILGLLPGMRERKTGHIINVSSIGAQTNTPRFSAYVASKSALDAFSRSIASEIVEDGVNITTVYMPLVRHADDRADRYLRRVPDRLARTRRRT